MKCFITESVYEKCLEEISKFPNLETGGAVMGYANNDEFVITHATGPGDNAIHQYAFFQVGDCQQEVNKIWYSMFGSVDIIGYWHNHLEPIPNPSSTDMTTLTTSKENELMMIFGTEKIKVWCNDEQVNELDLFTWNNK